MPTTTLPNNLSNLHPKAVSLMLQDGFQPPFIEHCASITSTVWIGYIRKADSNGGLTI